MMVNVNGQYHWLWNLIDLKSRYLLGQCLTARREVADAKQLFFQAKCNAKTSPKRIITDGLTSYHPAYKRVFDQEKVEHVWSPRFVEPINNNRIERLHGSVRERDKVMRALDSLRSGRELLAGLRVYYNLIRPHMSLNGQTPAEAARLAIHTGENKWLSLIRESARDTPLD